MKRPNEYEEVLLYVLAVDSSQVKKHATHLYEWRGIVYEVLSKDQRRNVPAPWYSPVWFKEKEYRIREVGKQAAVYKRFIKK